MNLLFSFSPNLDMPLRFGCCRRRTLALIGTLLVVATALISAPLPTYSATPTSDTAALTGVVWNDLNSNRIRDPGEPPMSGVQVALVNSSCRAGTDCPVATSDADGNYGFTSLVPGTYAVAQVEDGEYRPIGTVILKAGTTSVIAIASTATGLVLIESAAAAAAVGAGSAGAAAGAAAGVTATAVAVPAAVASVAVLGAAVDTGSDRQLPPISP